MDVLCMYTMHIILPQAAFAHIKHKVYCCTCAVRSARVCSHTTTSHDTITIVNYVARSFFFQAVSHMDPTRGFYKLILRVTPKQQKQIWDKSANTWNSINIHNRFTRKILTLDWSSILVVPMCRYKTTVDNFWQSPSCG